ncbi:MAG: hypothetical protein AABX28_01185 [Nanoarchaeota archaeon]
MRDNKSGIVIVVLISLVLVLGGLVAYSFLVKPAITGYAVNAQTQGVQYAIYSIMKEAAKCQSVPLTFGNQTMNIIAIECLQNQQQTPENSG